MEWLITEPKQEGCPDKVFLKRFGHVSLPSWSLLERCLKGDVVLSNCARVLGLCLPTGNPLRCYVAYEVLVGYKTVADYLNTDDPTVFEAKFRIVARNTFRRRLLVGTWEFLRHLNSAGFYFTDFTLANVMATFANGGSIRWVDLDSCASHKTRIVDMVTSTGCHQGWYRRNLLAAERGTSARPMGESLNAWFVLALALFTQRLIGLRLVLDDDGANEAERGAARKLARSLVDPGGISIAQQERLVDGFLSADTAAVSRDFALSDSVTEADVKALQASWREQVALVDKGTPDWNAIGEFCSRLLDATATSAELRYRRALAQSQTILMKQSFLSASAVRREALAVVSSALPSARGAHG